MTYEQPERDKRKRGRPRVPEPGSAVTTWLPASEHDRIVKVAARRGESVSATLRLMLKGWKPQA